MSAEGQFMSLAAIEQKMRHFKVWLQKTIVSFLHSRILHQVYNFLFSRARDGEVVLVPSRGFPLNSKIIFEFHFLYITF